MPRLLLRPHFLPNLTRTLTTAMAAAHVHPPPPPAAPLTLCDPAGHSTTTTGAQYAHIAFPLPTKRYVGMLHCQRDPLASELVTRVVRCEKAKAAESAPSAAAGGKSKSKGKGGKAPAPQEEAMTPAVQEEWEVELEDTVLFPEGGGQPSDTGRIVPLPATDEQSSGTAVEPVTVRQVIRRNLDAVHFVSQPLEVGQQVRLEVDMVRRHDLMDQHTGQHVSSGALCHCFLRLTPPVPRSCSRPSSSTNTNSTPSPGRSKSFPN